MKLKEIFAAIWNAIENPYSLYHPAPEVMEKLEAEGWMFEHFCVPSPHTVTTYFTILTPEGRTVSKAEGHRDDFARYEIAYARAVKACEAEKEATRPPQPKP